MRVRCHNVPGCLIGRRRRRRHNGTNTHTQDGVTALMYAVSHGRADCVRLLLDAGADTNAKDKVRGRSFASVVGRLFVL